jgi:hypothetical protein
MPPGKSPPVRARVRRGAARRVLVSRSRGPLHEDASTKLGQIPLTNGPWRHGTALALLEGNELEMGAYQPSLTRYMTTAHSGKGDADHPAMRDELGKCGPSSH